MHPAKVANFRRFYTLPGRFEGNTTRFPKLRVWLPGSMESSLAGVKTGWPVSLTYSEPNGFQIGFLSIFLARETWRL
jgi:hypothetical protein